MSDTFAMARARRALEEAGLDPSAPLERASSVTNEVWLSPEYAIRVNRHPNQRLRREATIGPLLPPGVNYPEIVAYGGRLGADWLIVRRQPGGVLARAWPGMHLDERREAVRQLAGILRSLHTFSPPEPLPESDSPQLLDGTRFRTVDPLLDALQQARSLPNVDSFMLDQVRSIVEEYGHCIDPFNVTTLMHGDIHFENVLWDAENITALLDFEYCRAAPADLDLDVLLRFCAYPFLHVAEDYEHFTRAEDYEPVPYWLAEDYPELFSFPDAYDRARIYSIAYDVRELLEFPPPRPPRELSRYHPHNRLDMLTRHNSHIDRLAGREDFAAASLDRSTLSPFSAANPGLEPPYVADASPPLGRSAT